MFVLYKVNGGFTKDNSFCFLAIGRRHHSIKECVCVCSNSRNDVSRVAQRYGTIAAHTRHRASVLVLSVVFCVHMYSFAGLIRRTPCRRSVALQSPTATLIPLFSSSELTGCGYPGLLDRKNRSDMRPRWESNPRLPACKASTLSTRHHYILVDSSTYMLDESICHFRDVRPSYFRY